MQIEYTSRDVGWRDAGSIHAISEVGVNKPS